MGQPLSTGKGSQVKYSKLDRFPFLEVFIIVANIVNVDEMQHYATCLRVSSIKSYL